MDCQSTHSTVWVLARIVLLPCFQGIVAGKSIMHRGLPERSPPPTGAKVKRSGRNKTKLAKVGNGFEDMRGMSRSLAIIEYLAVRPGRAVDVTQDLVYPGQQSTALSANSPRLIIFGETRRPNATKSDRRSGSQAQPIRPITACCVPRCRIYIRQSRSRASLCN